MISLDSKDKVLGWGIVIAAIIATTAGVIWFVSADATVPFSFLAATGLMFFVGVLLISSDWLEHHMGIMDEIEAFPHAFSYHWELLKQGHPTRAFYMWFGTIILVLGSIYLIFKYDKWNHTLFLSISAVVMGLIIGVVLAWVFIKTSWFQQRQHQTPWWWYGIVAIGIVLAAGLGIYYTEPVEYGGPTQWQVDARGQTYNYTQTRGYTGYFWSNSSSSSYSGSGFSFDCDEDACIGIIIIAIVVILVLASATTPHFWVTAIISLSFLLLLLSFREIYPLSSNVLWQKPSKDG